MHRFILLSFFFVSLFAVEKKPGVYIFQTPDEVGEAVAEKMVNLIVAKQTRGESAVLGLATGKTPIPTYRAFTRIVKARGVDLSHVVTFNLDEYLGLNPDSPESFQAFMFEHLFESLLASEENPKGFRLENIHIPNGAIEDLSNLTDKELGALESAFPSRAGYSLTEVEQQWLATRRAAEYEALIDAHGPIDIQILGIGQNGHIGFAEPKTPFESTTMVVELEEKTRIDNAPAFKGILDAVPKYALTMGIATILRAEEIVLLATGDHKASIVYRALRGDISPSVPSSALRLHKNASFVLDAEAAGQLRGRVTKFINAKILIDHEFQEGELWVRGGKIAMPEQFADETIDLGGSFLAPGYLDLQINGAFGVDFSLQPQRVDGVAKEISKYGVTGFLPTIVSSEAEKYNGKFSRLRPRKTEGAEILGIHLEGPYFSAKYNGAHNPDFLQLAFEPDQSVYMDLEGVKMITLAPEIPGGIALIRAMKDRGILVSAGHTNATFLEMQDAIDAGVGLVTHLFNAMRPFHHRELGVVGSALIDPGLDYSLIVDGIHILPETVQLAWQLNPKGLFLVTDATAALGLENGAYRLGAAVIEVVDGRVYAQGTNVLAGSSLSLDQAVRNLCAFTGCSIADAIEAASTKPAKLLGIYPKKGALYVGSDADFIVLDDELYVQATYVNGKQVY